MPTSYFFMKSLQTPQIYRRMGDYQKVHLLIISYFYPLFDGDPKNQHEIVNISANLLKKQRVCAILYADYCIVW